MKQRDQRKKKRPGKLEPLARLIHFPEGEVWSWKFGGHVSIRTPDHKTTFEIPLTEITGLSDSELERGAWKGWWKGLGPGEVKDYIELHLRPDPRIIIPPVTYLHPRFHSTWHIYQDCRFVPNKPHHKVNPVPVLGTHLAERLGEKPTRRNLCSVCMRRLAKGQLAAHG